MQGFSCELEEKHSSYALSVYKSKTILESIFDLSNLKSVNLEYNTLVRWFAGTNESSTKRLMFQVLFFFHDF